jgi:putative nucleotidyltransferase with HDIG domain
MEKNSLGTIITFYSYKGGTGRSMALANVACLIARESQKRVLIIDWDLEAPGLHRFFPEKTESDDRAGLIEMFRNLEEIFSSNQKLVEKISTEDGWKVLDKSLKLSSFVIPDVQPNVDLIKAGKIDAEYSNKVASFDWDQYFRLYGFSIHALRELIKNSYDYCLIDSRTGFTDTSGICTALFPEKLVLVFTPNKQSLYGVLDVAKRAIKYRLSSNDLRPLSIYPLPSRVDDAEDLLRKQWRAEYQIEFEKLLADVYELKDCDLSSYFDEVKLPYKSFYGYGEIIAAITERDESLSLHRAYKDFFQVLTQSDEIWLETTTDSILREGKLHEGQGRLSEAVQSYQKALFQFEQNNDQRGQSFALINLGNAYQKLADFDQAIMSYNKSLSIADRTGDVQGQANIIYNLGNTYLRIRHIAEAIKNFQRSLLIFEKLGDGRGQIVVLNSLGVAFEMQGSFDEARDVLQHCYQLQESLGDESGLAITLSSLGTVLHSQGKYDEAIKAFQRSIEIEEKLGNLQGRAMALYSLGGILQRQGKYDDAINILRQSIDVEEKIGDLRGQAQAIYSLGSVFESQEKFDDAIGAYQNSLSIERKLGSRDGQVRALNSLGNVFRRLEKLEQSEVLFREAIELDPTYGDAYSNLGKAYYDQKRFSEALNYFQKSVEIDQRYFEGWYWIGKVYFEIKRPEDAIAAWLKGLELKDQELVGHNDRVTSMTLKLAKKMGISLTELENIRLGAMLHDIGKMAVPDSVMNKMSSLNDSEWKLMREHVIHGEEMLKDIPYLSSALDIPIYHHERWDGTGYIRGLKGNEIPISARIFAVVDVWDALTSDRPYRKGYSKKQIINFVQDNAGTIFDPQVAKTFVELLMEEK